MRLPPGLVVVSILGLLAFGCSTKKVLRPNVAPETQLFVRYDPTNGVPHSVYHIAHLYWYGTDSDGFIAGYDIRFIWPSGPADPPWTRTIRTDSVFVIPDTTGLSNPVFEVRAVDDAGMTDPTPPRQEFSFTNQAPVLNLLDSPQPNETTIGTQTIAWSCFDPDGDANQLVYHVWLDGNESNPHVLTTTEFTFPTSDFLQGGKLRTGPRTAYVKAVDAGGRASVVRSATWQVLSPVPDTLQRPRLILIDDVPSSDGNNAVYDDFYLQAVNRSGIPAGSWRVVPLDSGRPFRSSKDLEQTLKLYDAVVWYRGQVPYSTFPPPGDTLLARHAEGLSAYLDAGGKLYLESLEMVASGPTPGLVNEDFMRRYLASDRLYKNKPSSANDSLAAWSISTTYRDTLPGGTVVTNSAIVHSSVFADSLKSARIIAGLRAFVVRDTNDVVLWARERTLTERQPFDAPVAVKSSLASGGLVVATTVPIARMTGYAGSTTRFIDKIFFYLGIKP
jgi:hypothetical protein